MFIIYHSVDNKQLFAYLLSQVCTSHNTASQYFTPKHTISTQTDTVIPEHPPSYINLLKSHPYAPLSTDDVYLEEASSYVDDSITYEPIVVEPDDEEFDLSSSQDTFDLSSSRDSSNLLLSWSRNNIQVTDLIDELIQQALVEDETVGDTEPLVDETTAPVKKKKSKVTKKSNANSRNLDSGNGKDGEMHEDNKNKIEEEPQVLAWEIDCTDFVAPKRKPKKTTGNLFTLCTVLPYPRRASILHFMN